MSVMVREAQTPLLETPQVVHEAAQFETIVQFMGVVSSIRTFELSVDDRDNIATGRRLRIQAIDDEYKSFKPIHM